MRRNLMICDRCDVNDYEGRSSLMKFSSLALFHSGVDDASTEEWHWDLCEDCVRDLHTWMENEVLHTEEKKPR